MSGEGDDGPPLSRALTLLWRENAPPRHSSGLSRDRIVAAAIAIADADGLAT